MNAGDVLKYGHLTVLGAIDGLPEVSWKTSGVCGSWSVKDIIAHLTSYELVLVDVLNTQLSPGQTPYLDKYTEKDGNFNDSQVAMRIAKSVDETLAEYKAAHARVMALVAQIPPERFRQNGTIPWYGNEYSLDDFITYGYYGHKREHCAQIAVYRDHLTA